MTIVAQDIRQAETDESDHGRFLSIRCVYPSPENDGLYKPIDQDDPEFIELRKSIEERGILEPIVITADHFIVSGHRRYAAAVAAGLDRVPVRELEIWRQDDIAAFTILLREHNRQRIKTFDEKLREEVLCANPEDAYQSLISHRQEKSKVKVDALDLGAVKHRAKITAAKQRMVDAVMKVIESLRNYWPLSDRKIHYELLNDPPLIHASKPGRYANDLESYRKLTELLTRGRIAGLIPMESIGDETRPVSTWNVNRDVQGFIRTELEGLLKNYWRDLMQSQPNHIEILCEKNTARPILEPVAMKYCIPLVTGRGFCSLPPRYELVQRFRKSGKTSLILLIVTDHDPAGMTIASSFGRSIRDDFGIENMKAIKVALTRDQVVRLKLPAGEKAKPGASTYDEFVAENGDNIWELEALQPAQLQQIVTDAIDSVIDPIAFNHELDRERDDAASLDAPRRRMLATMGVAQ